MIASQRLYGKMGKNVSRLAATVDLFIQKLLWQSATGMGQRS